MNKINVLDYGYVELIEMWGSEERIIEAARMSTNKGFKGWGPIHEESCTTLAEPKRCICKSILGDEKLLAYLFNNHHDTPFEMAGMIIEVQAPIFVFREWHRHRTQSYNEMSARYTPLPDVNYVPTVERLMMGNGQTNKQAGGVCELTKLSAKKFRDELREDYLTAEQTYQRSLRSGIPKELARLVLPVGRYSRMRASANLRNWLGFLRLRQASNAQWEIQQFANAVGEMIAESFPRTWKLFESNK